MPFEGRQATLTPVTIQRDGKAVKAYLFAGGHTTPGYKDCDPKTDKALLIFVNKTSNGKTEISIAPTGAMNEPRWGHRAIPLPDGTIFVSGGNTGSNCEIYDPKTEKFILSSLLADARSGHEQILLPDGKVLIVAGYAKGQGKTGMLSSIEMFDPISGTITQVANLQSGKAGHGLVQVGDKVYIIGGSKDSTKIEAWNIKEKKLMDSGISLDIALKDFKLHALEDKIYICGGTDLATGVSSAAIVEINTTTCKVRELGSKLSEAREDVLLVSSTNGKKIVIISGEIKNKGQANDGDKSGSVDVVDLELDTIKTLPNKLLRDDSRSVEISSGVHLILGGTTDNKDTFAHGADEIRID